MMTQFFKPFPCTSVALAILLYTSWSVLSAISGVVAAQTPRYGLADKKNETDSTLDFHFTYSDHLRTVNHTFKIKHTGITLFDCEVWGDRGRPEVSSKDTSYFQIIKIPMDYFLNRFVNEDYLNLKAEVNEMKSGTNLHSSISFYYELNSIRSDFFEPSIDLYVDDAFAGSAVFLKDDSNIPRVSRKSQISIKLSKTHQNYNYHMKLHRTDVFAGNLCPTADLGGEINLREYIGLFALQQCEVTMNRTVLTLQGLTMPFGFIRVTMDISNATGSDRFSIQRYFFVEEDNKKTEGNDLFQPVTQPNVDFFTASWDEDLIINTSQSFFPYAHKSFGQDGFYKHIIRHDRSCSGHSHICKIILQQKEPTVIVDASEVQKIKKKTTVTITVHWQFQFHKFGKKYKNKIVKTVEFRQNSLLVDIVCVRNCLYRYSPNTPGVFRAELAIPGKIKYRWEVVGGGLKVEGKQSKYLSILQSSPNSDIKISVIVNLMETDTYRYVKGSKSSLVVHAGRSSKLLVLAKDNRFLSFEETLEESKRATLFNTFDIQVQMNLSQLIDEGLFPISTHFRSATKDRDISKQVEVCTLVSPYKGLALRMSEGPIEATIGLQTDGGRSYQHTQLLLLPYKSDSELLGGDFMHRCRKSVEGASGLTNILALAQEISESSYPYEEITECYYYVIKYLYRDPATIKNSFLIHNMFFFSGDASGRFFYFLDALAHLKDTRRRLFHNTLEPTEELTRLTRYMVQGLDAFFESIKIRHDYENDFMEGLNHDASLDAIFGLLRLMENREKSVLIKTSLGQIGGMWLDASKTFKMTLTHQSPSMLVRFTIQNETFQDTMRSLENDSTIERKDSFLNIIALVTDRKHFLLLDKHGESFQVRRPKTEFPIASLRTELKISAKRIELSPQNKPIVIDFERDKPPTKHRRLDMQVIEYNGEVIDSTCLILEVPHTDSRNATIHFELPEGYQYSLAVIMAKYSTEFIGFADMHLKPLGNKFSYHLTTVSSNYLLDNPESKALLMVRVVPSPNLGNLTAMKDILLTRGNEMVRRTLHAKIMVLTGKCYNYNFKQNKFMRNTTSCKEVPQDDPRVVRCHCYVDSMYSARQRVSRSSISLSLAKGFTHSGPSYMPGICIGMILLMFMFYAYWGYFLDIKEKDCAQTHVIKDMYDPDSIEQYLVCIRTGIKPRSGTDGRVGFLLVGEMGSLKFIRPEGTHVHSTGSETWFLLSSDLELGNIVGITISYDKYVSGALLYPWLLKDVVLYCMNNNHVIVFKSNKHMGVQLPLIELPTLPHESVFGEEIRIRLWGLMRRYHTVCSVLFHIPGIGVTNTLSALSSLFVVVVTCAVAIEIVGEPNYISHLHTGKVQTNHLVDILKLAPITLFLSISIKNIYALIFRKPVGVLWYNKPQPLEGYWQGGVPSKSWLSLVGSDKWREHHTLQLIDNWISKMPPSCRCKKRTHNTPVAWLSETRLEPQIQEHGSRIFINKSNCSYRHQFSVQALKFKWFASDNFRMVINPTRVTHDKEAQEKVKESQIKETSLLSKVKDWNHTFFKKRKSQGDDSSHSQTGSTPGPSKHRLNSATSRRGTRSDSQPTVSNAHLHRSSSNILAFPYKPTSRRQISALDRHTSSVVGAVIQGEQSYTRASEALPSWQIASTVDVYQRPTPRGSPGTSGLNIVSKILLAETDQNKNRNDGREAEIRLSTDGVHQNGQALNDQGVSRAAEPTAREATQISSVEIVDESMGGNRNLGLEQTLREEPSQSARHDLQPITIEDPTSWVSNSPLLTNNQENIACDASDEDSSSVQVKPKFKRSLSKRNTQPISSEKFFGNEMVKGTGDVSCKTKPTFTRDAPHEMNFKSAPKRPSFFIVKNSGRFTVSTQNTKLNRWGVISKNDDVHQNGHKNWRAGPSKTNYNTRCLTPYGLFSAKRRANSSRITSFREFYFRPVLRIENERRQTCNASPPKTGFQFLRKSRYLEKMVKDYDLGELYCSNLEGRVDVSASFDSTSDTSKEESIESLFQDGKNPLQKLDGTSNRTSIWRKILNLPKPKLERKRQDYKRIKNAETKLKSPEDSFPSLKSFLGCKTKQGAAIESPVRRRQTKKPASAANHCTRSFLNKLCIQFKDSESECDYSPAVYEEAKVSKTCQPTEPFETSHYHVVNRGSKSPIHTKNSKLLGEQDRGECRDDTFLEVDSTYPEPRVSKVCPKADEEHVFSCNDRFRRLQAPGVATGAKIPEGRKYSSPASKGTLSMLKRKALMAFSQFVVQTTSSAATKSTDTLSGSSTDNTGNLPQPPSFSAGHNNTDESTSQPARCFGSCQVKPHIDENRNATPVPGGPVASESNGPIGSEIHYNTAEVSENTSVDNLRACSEVYLDKPTGLEEQGTEKGIGQQLNVLLDRLPILKCICFFMLDFIKTTWSLRMYFVRIPLVAATVGAIILCAGWVILNATIYSKDQVQYWCTIVITTLLLNIMVVEPFIYLNVAAISTHFWTTPNIINECLKRFKTVIGDINYRDWMVALRLAGRHRTCFRHQQATPETFSLFYLHDRIFKALTKVTKLPHVTFHMGVYRLIFYTICTLIFVNARLSIYNANLQSNFIKQNLKLPPSKPEQITVDVIWNFIRSILLPGLLELKYFSNITVSGDESQKVSIHPGFRGLLGSSVFTPVRIRQLRVRPLNREEHAGKICSPLPRVILHEEWSCNFEFSTETEDKASYGNNWSTTRTQRDEDNEDNEDKLSRIFKHHEDPHASFLTSVDLLPKGGYLAVMHFDNMETPSYLEKMQQSRWIDQYTRYILIDFNVLNPSTSVASAYRVTMDFKRPAPFWHTTDFHFGYVASSELLHLSSGVLFTIATIYCLIQEVTKLNKRGYKDYLLRFKSYVEASKIGLSVLLYYIFFKMSTLLHLQMDVFKHGCVSKRPPEYVDFFEMANLDFLFKSTGGLLAFICIFQLFGMLSKIRRLLVFIRMLKSALHLFLIPLFVGLTFGVLAHLLFGNTNSSFSNLVLSYLVINQSFIKPQAIYKNLTEEHPYLGPCFVFSLGFCINFFVMNFFIALLNDAYSSIITQIRFQTYKTREKTKLQYMYEFLGIRTSKNWDRDEELQFQEARQVDREMIKNLKMIKSL